MLEELPYYSLCYRKIGLVGVQGFAASELPMFNDYYKNIETWSWSYMVETGDDSESEDDTENAEIAE